MEQRKARMKDFLAESLVVLMQEKPFEKITIKQICDRTGVIRATFYNHFEDKYAALDYVCGMMLCEKRQALIAAGEMESYIRSLCIEIYDHAGVFRKAFQVQGQNDFDTMFLTHAGRGIRAILDQEGRWEGAYDSEELSLYYANAFMYLCKEWLREGCRHTPQEFAAYSSGLLLHGLRDYLGKEM